MSSPKKLCIFYLTDDRRHFFFQKFVQQYSACKYKEQIDLLILTHCDDSDIYAKMLYEGNVMAHVLKITEGNNYMSKVKFAAQHAKRFNIPYLLKHDNDIVMSSHMYNYLFENLGVLEDPKNLILTPTLTSGIPTVETFVEDFCNAEEKAVLHQLFRAYPFPDNLWGVNYTPLNQFSLHASEWNGKAYWDGVSKIDHHYKGIHPIRMSVDAASILNQIVIHHKDRILGPLENVRLEYDSTSPYFCNSIFCMKTDTYKTIIEDQTLFRDGFDEVPVNLYRNKHNLNVVYTRNACAIHFMYNCVTHYILLERVFLQQL